MTKTKLYPYIHRETGEVKTLTRFEGSQLGKDWHRAKIARNEKGEKVFRFQIATQMTDENGKVQRGIATVDLQEIKTEAVEDGNGNPE